VDARVHGEVLTNRSAPDPPSFWRKSCRLAAMVRGMQIGVIRVPVSFVGRQGDPAPYVVEDADFRAWSD
jgi:hypothetical protein